MYEVNQQGYRWWEAPEDQLYREIYQYVSFLNSDQSYRYMDNIRNLRLYSNYDILGMGLDAYNYTRIESTYNTTHRVTMNIIASLIDTIAAKITKSKPKPMFLTDEGDWDLQQKAKKLTKYCEGVFDDINLYQEAQRAFVDSCIFGTGCVKFFTENNEIKCERVLIDEIKVDDSEGFYGKPRSMHQTKYIHRDVLNAMFPGNEVWINQSSTFETEYSINKYYRNKQMVHVIESWHLPSSKDSNDGFHCITISNKTLFVEKYNKSYFPFIFFRWSLKPSGFWGQGISEQLTGIQLEINKILRTIQVSMHLVSIPKLMVEASSKIVSAHLNNKIGGIIKYAGTPPQYSPLGGIPVELFSHLDRLFQRAYEICGVSQLAARSDKPAGLNSGKALREFSDIESERFLMCGTRYERTFIDAAKIVLDLARDIYKDTGKFSVKVKGDSFLQTIHWDEVDMDEDKYIMRIFPTSSLASTPAAKLQDVIELLQAGFISKEDGMKLLDFPDLKSVTNLYMAAREDIEKTISSMMHKGEYLPPEPYQDLVLGRKLMQQSYLQYRMQNAPEDRLELLRRWVEDAGSMLIKLQEDEAASAAPAPVEQPAAPIAAPLPQPSSDILPVA